MTMQPMILASVLSLGLIAEATAQTVADEAKASDERDSPVLQEVVVTAANRIGKALDRIPGAISVISTADVQQNIAVTEDVTKVLEHSLPGYSPSREGRYTFGETLRGRRPLYLIDGIPQSTPLRDGSVGSYFVDLSMIARVETINGPSATEGLGAAGGIINYITKTPRPGQTEVNLDSKVSSQFHDDVAAWRAGINHLRDRETDFRVTNRRCQIVRHRELAKPPMQREPPIDGTWHRHGERAVLRDACRIRLSHPRVDRL